MIPGAEMREPSRDELVAAGQVVDLFAAEALLALDRYERSFPAEATDQARQTADRLAHWWRKLDMDAARVDPEGTDAEQILAAAADLSLDPENHSGLSLEEASAQASNRAAMEGRTPPSTSITDLRKAFDDAYGGRVDLPTQHDVWLAQSLTRLARASVLRDVVAEGAQVKVSAPLRQAADDMVRQGRQLMDDRQDLARRHEAWADQQEGIKDQAAFTSLYVAYSLAVVGQVEIPVWAHLAAHAPALALYLKATIDNLKAHSGDVETRLDPAQAQLRSVRGDLIGNLDTSPPATRRDNGAPRKAANRRTGPGR
jgi:hypothetical protein